MRIFIFKKILLQNNSIYIWTKNRLYLADIRRGSRMKLGIIFSKRFCCRFPGFRPLIVHSSYTNNLQCDSIGSGPLLLWKPQDVIINSVIRYIIDNGMNNIKVLWQPRLSCTGKHQVRFARFLYLVVFSNLYCILSYYFFLVTLVCDLNVYTAPGLPVLFGGE